MDLYIIYVKLVTMVSKGIVNTLYLLSTLYVTDTASNFSNS